MIKPYLRVIKPGIIFGNAVSVIGGFLLAAKGSIDPLLLLATLGGVSLVIASGCVFNNYIDRDIDSLMERTKNRPLVQGQISSPFSLGYASLLGMCGFTLLYSQTNLLATLVALGGFTIYVGFYSLYLKRKSIYGTLVGSFSGATPPVIGYCAVSGEFNSAALILLLIFSLWQMPHSYAIAIFRLQDYRAAAIPVLPLKKGIAIAKNHIALYIIAFAVMAMMLTLYGHTGYLFFAVALALSGYWLWLVFSGYGQDNDAVWAKRLFLFSILTITTLSVMMSIDFIPEQLGRLTL